MFWCLVCFVCCLACLNVVLLFGYSVNSVVLVCCIVILFYCVGVVDLLLWFDCDFVWLVFYGFGVYLVWVCLLLIAFVADDTLLLLIRLGWLFVRWWLVWLCCLGLFVIWFVVVLVVMLTCSLAGCYCFGWLFRCFSCFVFRLSLSCLLWLELFLMNCLFDGIADRLVFVIWFCLLFIGNSVAIFFC